MRLQPGTKEFVNETGVYLQVSLAVRTGNDPHKPPLKVVSFEMEKGTKTKKIFDDGNNPFLNEISVKAFIDGAVKWVGKLVVDKGSEVDTEFNTRDTVIFRYKRYDLYWYDTQNARDIRQGGRNMMQIAEVVSGAGRMLTINIFDDHGRIARGGRGGYLMGNKPDVWFALNRLLDQLRGHPGAFYPPPRPHPLTGSQEDEIMATVASLLDYPDFQKRKLTLEMSSVASVRSLAGEPKRFEFTMVEE